jgi:hypothetical protein
MIPLFMFEVINGIRTINYIIVVHISLMYNTYH